MTVVVDKDGYRIILEHITNYSKNMTKKDHCRVFFANGNSEVFNLTCEELDYAFKKAGKVFWMSDDES